MTRDRRDWCCGKARCLYCGHRQVSVFPAAMEDPYLQCGACRRMTAVVVTWEEWRWGRARWQAL